MSDLLKWCNQKNIFIKENSEVFFVDEKLLMRPEFIINNKIYIDLVEDNEMNSKYLEFCRLFSSSFGTLIVIPRNTLPSIINITKNDIEERFNIKL